MDAGATVSPDLHDEQLDELRREEAAIRRVRWLAVVFTLLQFHLYKPPAGVAVPFDLERTGLLIAGAVLAVNLVSLAGRRVRRPDVVVRLQAAELVADAAIVMAVVWLFSFDPTSALWALLVIPVLEWALRGQLAGALTAWAGLSVAYAARDVWAAHEYPYVPFAVESVTYRLGIVLIVAVASGYLARNCVAQVRAHREARGRAQHHARALGVVASAVRTMTTLDPKRVLDVVVDSVRDLGFDAAWLSVLDPVNETYRIDHPRGVPETFVRGVYPSSWALPAMVRARHATVQIDDVAAGQAGLDALTHFGIAAAVATPVWVNGELRAVLEAANLSGERAPTPQDVEAFELLAAQAGRALENAQRFAEEHQAAQLLARASLTDDLTGVGNRRHANALIDSLQPGDGLLLIDIDHFKEVNDTRGHAGGDAVLVTLAQFLRDCVREADDVARYGGEEFVVVLRDAKEGVRVAADRLIEHWRMRCPTTTFSVGLGIHRATRSPAVTLGEADAALYAAKAMGRDRVCQYGVDLALPVEREVSTPLA